MIKKITKPDFAHEASTVVFLGDSLDVISAFPDGVKRNLGHGIRCVQEGLDPPDSKPLTISGPGVFELRDADEAWLVSRHLSEEDRPVRLHTPLFSKEDQQNTHE